jgi:hypothetical protein
LLGGAVALVSLRLGHPVRHDDLGVYITPEDFRGFIADFIAQLSRARAYPWEGSTP